MAPLCTRPTSTSLKVTGCDPNVFVSRTRSALPPTLVKTIFRTVWLLNPAAETSPGMKARLLGVAAWGLADHDATQWLPPSLLVSARTLPPGSNYAWPGNVRQLKNVAERLIVRARHAVISIADLPPEIAGRAGPAAVVAVAPGARTPIDVLFDRMIEQRESFWSAVYPAFMTRDLTRSDLRVIVKRGLQETYPPSPLSTLHLGPRWRDMESGSGRKSPP